MIIDYPGRGNSLKTRLHLNTPLGKRVESVSVYTPSLLCTIPRQVAREGLGIGPDRLPFRGVDVWSAYELSWLNARGLPELAMAEFVIPCDSPNLVESKSMKLYLNSLNQTRFSSVADVATTIERDLCANVGAPVTVELVAVAGAQNFRPAEFEGDSLDLQDVGISRYQPDKTLLSIASLTTVDERLYSDLFRSLCPVTGQPDWASVTIAYRGPAIDRGGLLRYLVSYREHAGFHEQCVERIFLDLLEQCRPRELTVYARFLRRGGLDINPFRSNQTDLPPSIRLVRQ